MSPQFEILREFSSVMPYVDSVRSLADQHRTELGFLPAAAYDQHAAKGCLWVAVSADVGECVGYLMFGGRYPTLKVVQLFVRGEARGRGIGHELIDVLADYGIAEQYQAIVARVGADLPANHFWDRAGFPLVRQEAGGQSTGRTINIRVRELATPPLLELMAYHQPVPSTDPHTVQFSGAPTISSPVYVLDLNVFFDVVRNRLHREEAARLITAGLNHQVKVRVTPEFIVELERHQTLNDPVLEFAKQLPTVPQVPENILDELAARLRALVFPNRDPNGKNGAQTDSDVRHLATCVHHGAAGFITRERAILVARDHLLKNFALEVLSPADLFSSNEALTSAQSAVRTARGDEQLVVEEAPEARRNDVQQFLAERGIESTAVATIWDPGTRNVPKRRVVASTNDDVVAVASWNRATQQSPITTFHLYVDEESSFSERAIDHLFESVLRDADIGTARLIKLISTAEQIETRATARRRLFGPTEPGILTKFAFNGLVTPLNWSTFVKDLARLTGLRVNSPMPDVATFSNTGLLLSNDDGEHLLRLHDFETLVAPAMILCPERTGVIVPIRKSYARDLFTDIDQQGELFPQQEAILHVEKAYFRNPRNARRLAPGMPIVFYLSGKGGGTKEAIGMGRVTSSRILDAESIPLSMRRQGVLSSHELQQYSNQQGKVHAITFDNYSMFQHRIPFAWLRENDIVSGANLVTAEALSHANLDSVCSLGFLGKQ